MCIHICTHITNSLWCIAETNIINQPYTNKNLFKIKIKNIDNKYVWHENKKSKIQRHHYSVKNYKIYFLFSFDREREKEWEQNL